MWPPENSEYSSKGSPARDLFALTHHGDGEFDEEFIGRFDTRPLSFGHDDTNPLAMLLHCHHLNCQTFLPALHAFLRGPPLNVQTLIEVLYLTNQRQFLGGHNQ